MILKHSKTKKTETSERREEKETERTTMNQLLISAITIYKYFKMLLENRLFTLKNITVQKTV